jgi:hypothetical protein
LIAIFSVFFDNIDIVKHQASFCVATMSEKQEYKPVEMEEGIGVPLFGEVATVASVKAVPCP